MGQTNCILRSLVNVLLCELIKGPLNIYQICVPNKLMNWSLLLVYLKHTAPTIHGKERVLKT